MPIGYTGTDTCCKISAISSEDSWLALSTPSVKSRMARLLLRPFIIFSGVAATASKRAVWPEASRSQSARTSFAGSGEKSGHEADLALGEGEQREVVARAGRRG